MKNLEKRVSHLLSRKKIENFYPVNCKQIKQYNQVKPIYEPLISGYVFVHIPETDIDMVKRIPNVINIVYWKGQPALINNQEIKILKNFVDIYSNIKVESVGVGLGEPEFVNDSAYSSHGNGVAVRASSVKVHLPSLGLLMKAENERENKFETRVSIFSRPAKLAADPAQKEFNFFKTITNTAEN